MIFPTPCSSLHPIASVTNYTITMAIRMTTDIMETAMNILIMTLIMYKNTLFCLSFFMTVWLRSWRSQNREWSRSKILQWKDRDLHWLDLAEYKNPAWKGKLVCWWEGVAVQRLLFSQYDRSCSMNMKQGLRWQGRGRRWSIVFIRRWIPEAAANGIFTLSKQ